MTDPDPMIGRILHGSIELRRKIGAGGMGHVYEGYQNHLDRIVAVKVLNAQSAQSPAAKSYFLREARSASQLRHPNIIQIIDYGEEDDDTVFIAMEFVPGKPLSKLIETEFPLSTDRIVDILDQTLAALSEAHRKQLVHRDLKPDNLMVEQVDGRDFVKVLDFGIAQSQAPNHEAGPLTMRGAVVGTPQYMSPEQAVGEQVDGRGDIFSLGVILYQLLTQISPFDGKSVPQILISVVQGDIPRPSEARPDLPIDPVLEGICRRAMQRKPENRFQSADEFREALRELRNSSAASDALDDASTLRDPPRAQFAPQPAQASVDISSDIDQHPRTPPLQRPQTPMLDSAAHQAVQPRNTGARLKHIELALADEVGAPSGTAHGPLTAGLSDSGRMRPIQPHVSEAGLPGATPPVAAEPPVAKQRSRSIIVLPVVLIVLVSGLIVVAVGYSALSHKKKSPPPDDGATIQKPKVADQETPSASDKPKAGTVPARIRLETTPPGLPVLVNGKSIGKSPTTVATSDIYFPAVVAARLDARHVREVHVTSPQEKVSIDFSDVEKTRHKEEVASQTKNPHEAPSHEREHEPKKTRVAHPRHKTTSTKTVPQTNKPKKTKKTPKALDTVPDKHAKPKNTDDKKPANDNSMSDMVVPLDEVE